MRTDVAVMPWHMVHRADRGFAVENAWHDGCSSHVMLLRTSILCLLVVGCGDGASVASDAGDGGSTSDSPVAADGGDGGNGSTCNYLPANNDARCPATYSFSYQGTPCPAVGLSCAYPGAGDAVLPGGCFATAMMWCHGDGGVTDLDGGADAGPGTWTVAQ